MNGGSLVYDVSGNGYGGTAVIGYRSARDYALISLYPKQDDPGLYVSRQVDGPGLQIDDCSIEISNEGHIDLWDNTYILSRGNAVYKGFKTPIITMKGTGEKYISSIDYHTIIVASSGITLIEEDPVIGKEYDIYTCYDTKLNLSGHDFIIFRNGNVIGSDLNTVNKPITINKNYHTHMVYSGEFWVIRQ